MKAYAVYIMASASGVLYTGLPTTWNGGCPRLPFVFGESEKREILRYAQNDIVMRRAR
jgi:hypothetical protein